MTIGQDIFNVYYIDRAENKNFINRTEHKNFEYHFGPGLDFLRAGQVAVAVSLQIKCG